ncbi:MAG TPA: RNB domain-containing ribonuclease [Silvibacterium sp.]|nr:RNB domain-containing ribonuclease [Silvibacterium sp.]
MSTHHPFDLRAAERQAMAEHGFEPDFSPEVNRELAALVAHPPRASAEAKDLRHLLWSSIDNDTSRDLDQIEYVEKLSNGDLRVMIGIADVDLYVPKGSAIDQHATVETATVYSGVTIFPMLPEVLSTGLTSLLEEQDRACIVTEFVFGSQNQTPASRIYPALVRNKAQLAYSSVGSWLEGKAEAPARLAKSEELQAQLYLQNHVAQRLRTERFERGALTLETIETRAVIEGGAIDIAPEERNLATDLIEDFMVAANGVVARTLREKHIPSIRRIVKTPKRWDRIVQLAGQTGEKLPAEPDSKALNDFLCRRKEQDPDHFADLSLAVVKLMGPGEYVLERPDDKPEGHFALAVEDYTHSTAPNRRYADLVTQRIVKAMIAGKPSPYSNEELAAIATNCTAKATAERKVEREMQKRIGAVALRHRIGNTFRAIVTGVTDRGTFVRTLEPHVDGMLVHGQQGVDVGDKLSVKLVRTDPVHGFIDFARL